MADDSFGKSLDEIKAVLLRHGINDSALTIELMDVLYRCVKTELTDMADKMMVVLQEEIKKEKSHD